MKDDLLLIQTMQKDFVAKLAQVYPTLSSTELKVAVLLSINLQSKQVAEVMEVTSKTVENHRTSIRKKMGLKRGDSLHKVLMMIR